MPRWPHARAAAAATVASAAAAMAAVLACESPAVPAALAAFAGAVWAGGLLLRSRWLADDAARARAHAETCDRLAAVGLATAGFAHEMKNAFMVLQGFAHLAQRDAEAPADGRLQAHLAEIEAQTRRGIDRLSAFLRLARGESVPGLRRPADELAEETAALVKPLAGLRDLAFDVSLARPAPALDDVAVREALLNVLLNAVDHARSRVSLALHLRDGQVELRVEDDGPGVPPEARATLFERWSAGRPGGHGLGLACAREALERVGGRIECGQAESGGARFVLHLPADGPP